MKKIEATIAPFKLEEVRDALVALGVHRMTVSEVKGLDPQAQPARYRGIEYVVWFAPRFRIDLVVSDDQVDECVAVIERSAETDEPGPSQLVVLPVDDAIRIQTGERLAPERAASRRPVDFRPRPARVGRAAAAH